MLAQLNNVQATEFLSLLQNRCSEQRFGNHIQTLQQILSLRSESNQSFRNLRVVVPLQLRKQGMSDSIASEPGVNV